MRAPLPGLALLAVDLCVGGPLRAVAESALGLDEVLEGGQERAGSGAPDQVELRRCERAVGSVCIAALHDDPWRRLRGGRAARSGGSLGESPMRSDAERAAFDRHGPPDLDSAIVRRQRP